jgi:hypothetical protein
MLAALVLMLGGVGQARAGFITLYNNLSATPSESFDVRGNGPLADSFSTGSSAVNLSDVKLLLESDSFTSTGSITVTLNKDSSTSPGGVLTTIGTFNNSSLSRSPTAIDFPTSYSLAANTRYWIEVSASNDSSAAWEVSTDTSGVGVANEYNSNSQGVFPNTGISPFQMEVTAQTAATGVPEPSTLTLLGLGSLGLLGYGRRRRKQAAA